MKIENFDNYDYLILGELEANICKLQNNYMALKFDEAMNYEDEGFETVGEYLREFPLISITAYNHNTKINLLLTDNTFEINLSEYDENIDFIEEDFKKLNKKLKEFLKINLIK